MVDAGSDPRVTVSLRRRIERGEVPGPAILTAGMALYPPDGVPYYLRRALPGFVVWLLPQPARPEEAVAAVQRNVAAGADLTKLFSGSYVQRGVVKPMPGPVARAAVDEAHRHGQVVYAHASNLAGTRVALEAGVDVLAHAPDRAEEIPPSLLRALAARRVAMIPTLQMFARTVSTSEAYLAPIREEVHTFHQVGGQLLFGTDVGYMADDTIDDELQALGAAGLSADDVLRMLTTAPAERFGAGSRRGTVEAGREADLVVLQGDPRSDLQAFARVAFTLRGGAVLYARR